jgi:N-acetylglutamate synthase-like GNAT family acetyltransferase
MIEICPFEKKYQNDINVLMADIQEEFSEIFSSPDSKTISQLTELNRDVFWVALYEEKVVGTVGLSFIDTKVATLKRMFVAKQFRGTHTNLSQKLLNTAINAASKMGIEEIYLGTMAQFKAAQVFYGKNKFVQILKSDLPDKVSMSSVDTVFYKFTINANKV